MDMANRIRLCVSPQGDAIVPIRACLARRIVTPMPPQRLVGVPLLPLSWLVRTETPLPPQGVLELLPLPLLRTRLTGKEELLTQWDRQLLPPVK